MSKSYQTLDVETEIKFYTQKIETTKGEIEILSTEVERLKQLSEINANLQAEITEMQENLAQTLENEKTKWEAEFAEYCSKVLKFDYVNRPVE